MVREGTLEELREMCENFKSEDECRNCKNCAYFKSKYIYKNPCIHKIIMHFKDEIKEKLRVALEPFKDEFKVPIEIRMVFGEWKIE